jgi:hypothetical protein
MVCCRDSGFDQAAAGAADAPSAPGVHTQDWGMCGHWRLHLILWTGRLSAIARHSRGLRATYGLSARRADPGASPAGDKHASQPMSCIYLRARSSTSVCTNSSPPRSSRRATSWTKLSCTSSRFSWRFFHHGSGKFTNMRRTDPSGTRRGRVRPRQRHARVQRGRARRDVCPRSLPICGESPPRQAPHAAQPARAR